MSSREPTGRREDALAWFDGLSGGSTDAHVLLDARSTVLAVDTRAVALLGRAPADLLGTGLDAFVHQHDEGYAGHLLGLLASREGLQPSGRARFLHADGTEIPVLITIHGVPPELDGGSAVAVASLTDLRPTLARALAEEQQLSAAVLNSVSDGMLVVSRGGQILRANPAAERILGHAPGGLVGRSVNEFVPAGVRPRHMDLVRSFAAVGPHIMGAHRQLSGVRRDGTAIPLEVTLTELDGYGDGHVCAVIRDVTERAAFEALLIHQSRHDPLTGLPNRVVLHERLDAATARLTRNEGGVAVLLVDVDHFKSINDVYGHGVGDDVLVQLARRMADVVRATDTLVRLSGDEFAIVADDLGGDPRRSALALAARLRRACAVPWPHQGRDLHPTVSIGVFVTGEPVPREQALSNADIALYEAKRSGRNTAAVFEPTMREQETTRQRLREQLHVAIRGGELEVHYQPLVDLVSDDVVAVEALVRWQHPTDGLLPPSAFLPAAAQDALMVDIDLQVMRTAARAVAALPRELAVWVNLSGDSLASPRLLPAVLDVLAETALPADRLVLEISESAMLTDSPRAIGALDDLSSAGVRLAIDDFGTGYSSLAHLARLPVSAVKLDRSFLATRPSTALVPGIVSVVSALGLSTVAEGIETPAHRSAVSDAGCNLGQGFALARPMPIEALAGWVATHA